MDTDTSMQRREQPSGRAGRKRNTGSPLGTGRVKKRKRQSYTDLCRGAIVKRDVALVRQYYQINPAFWETSFMTKNNETPLLYSMWMHDEDYSMFELLLQLGVNPNVISKLGQSALYVAIQTENLTMTRTLLSAKADPNLISKNGVSPLSMAGRIVNNADFTVALLKAGANVQLMEEDGTTALLNACLSNNLPVVHALIRAGADVNIAEAKGDQKMTPLLCATYFGNLGIVRALIAAKSDVARTYPSGYTLLDVAVEHGYKPIVLELLQTETYMKHNQKQHFEIAIPRAMEIKEIGIATLLLQYSCSSTPLFRHMVLGNEQMVYQLTRQQLQTKNGFRGELGLSPDEVLQCSYPGQMVLVNALNQVERDPFGAAMRALSRADHSYRVSFPAEVANLIFSYAKFDWIDIQGSVGRCPPLL